MIIQALQSLRDRDKSRHELVMARVLRQWQSIHILKEKHFGETTRQKDRDIIARIVAASGEHMKGPFEQALKNGIDRDHMV